ncbi:helix-turn-helix domain-containing protein [Chryseobacterium indologenes]|uniref:helix-turn-helix domain-containing protein n=1 Tax=Chryseobacterium indologenes TaxID=253 RepID=UPI00076E4336|nr:helix-turn-helix transcriptional regulator [Chryseobacterium indologenes]
MGLNVERILEKKGINKAKLSELLGRGDNRSYATNLLKSPSLASLEKIAEALEVDIVELFDPVDEKRNTEPIYRKDADGKEIIIGYLMKD